MTATKEETTEALDFDHAPACEIRKYFAGGGGRTGGWLVPVSAPCGEPAEYLLDCHDLPGCQTHTGYSCRTHARHLQSEPCILCGAPRATNIRPI